MSSNGSGNDSFHPISVSGNVYRPFSKRNVVISKGIEIKNGFFFYPKIGPGKAVRIFALDKPSVEQEEEFAENRVVAEFSQLFDEESIPKNYSLALRDLSSGSVSSREMGFWIAVSNVLSHGILSIDRKTDMPEGLSVMFTLAVGNFKAEGYTLASAINGAVGAIDVMEIVKLYQEEYIQSSS